MTMLRLKGIPAARGLAKGMALLWPSAPFEAPHFLPDNVVMEKKRLADARAQAGVQLRALAEQLVQQVGAAEAAVLEAQAMFVNDSALIKKAEAGVDAGQNAEWAWHEACDYFARQLENLTDETLRARAADVRDVSRRVIEVLLGIQSTLNLEDQSVIIARDLAPSQTASLDKSKVVAFCTSEGGPTSHTAILAKALGIPAVVGLGQDVLKVASGAIMLVDGEKGEVLVNPGAKTRKAFEAQIEADQVEEVRLEQLAREPAITKDGHRVEVVANVGSVEDARAALEHGAEGIGLLRTEFLFLNRTQPPDEQTQYAAYRAILDLMGERPVVARTLDIGGDKEVPYYDFRPQANPFLGYRAIRISLDRPADFKTQLRALLRASLGHDLRIMFPMIATLDEIRRAKVLVEEARSELGVQGHEVQPDIQIGIMMEIPSVALLADQFAREVDFFSVGTNDLTQYTLAAERGNKRLARLSDPCHPAVLREIEMVAGAARSGGAWVGVCGEMAGDLQAIPILLGLGVDELSMAPAQIPSAKQVIREWSLKDAEALARKVLYLESAEQVRHQVEQLIYQFRNQKKRAA